MRIFTLKEGGPVARLFIWSKFGLDVGHHRKDNINHRTVDGIDGVPAGAASDGRRIAPQDAVHHGRAARRCEYEL